MMLNPSKCISGVSYRKFLGFLVTKRAKPDQIQALLLMSSPKSIHDVHRLNRRVTALNRFISKLADKCLPFFKILKENKFFEWMNESKLAFQLLKKYIGSPHLLIIPNMGEKLTLYLSVSPIVVSVVLTKEENKIQRPVYYVNKILLEEENKYLRIDKLAYALIIVARKLHHYFQAYPIIVLTDQLLKQILQQPDTFGRLLK